MSMAEEYDDSYEDEYDEDGEITISGFTVLIVALVIVSLFLAIVWFAYQKGMRVSSTNSGAVPTIAADPSPVRTERDLASGSGNDGRSEVYDRLEGNTPTEVIIEAEAGKDPLDGFDEQISAADSDVGNLSDNGLRPTAVDVVNVEPIDVVKTPEEVSPGVGANKPIETAQATTPSTQPASSEPASTPAAQPVADSAAPAIASGTHVVQVAALRSDAEARAMFDKLSAKYGDYLNGKAPDIQRADLGAKGIYYRLRVGPFNSKDAAKNWCAGLKNRGQDCMVKAR